MAITTTDINGSGKRCDVTTGIVGVDDHGKDIWGLILQTSSVNVADTSVVLDGSIITQIDIQDAFCDVLQAVTGLPTIQGDQDGPTPQGNYISLRFVDIDSSAHDTTQHEYTDNGSVETVRGQSYCKLEVQLIGNGSMITGRKLIASMLHSNRQFDLGQLIGYCGADGPQNISEEWGGMFRQKALVNLYFYANLSFQDNADFITNGDIQVVAPNIYDKTFHVVL